IMCERVCGLARVLRGHAVTAMENVALWHERDISHSSAERIILPDATTLLHYMIHIFAKVMKDLHVYPDNMLRNMARSFDLVYSQQVLLRLVEKGWPREEAYDLVQGLAMRAWSEQVNFKALLLASPAVMAKLDESDINNCFKIENHFGHVDTVFSRLGL
ncbi:MAG: adenylosuccinate lyase, partial [bacterium]|nr:adenylosuccinate lyase [bacterium]